MMYNITGILDSLTNIVGVSSINHLYPGLYVYGDGIIPCSKIISIDSMLSTIEITNAPEKDLLAVPLYITDMNPYKFQELCEAKKSLLEMIKQQGMELEFVVRDENDITRDKYNSIQRKAQNEIVKIHAFPVEFSPTPMKLEKVGIMTSVDVLAYTSVYEWELAGFQNKPIDEIRTTVKFNGNVYAIKQTHLNTAIGSEYLYKVFGLMQR